MCEYQKYSLIIDKKLNGQSLSFSEFPDLNIKYIKSENNLCPSYYSSAVCIQAGNLSITLKINDNLITLNSDMKDEIVIDDYKFKGLEPIVKNKSKNQTYMIISIEKCDKHIYNLGQPFILEFHDNPSTGYIWTLKVTPGIKIIKDTHSNRCIEGITGCGGVRTFVLEGIKKGDQEIIATHGRPWDPTTNTTYIYKYNIL
jgi:predicted secreted protein